MRANPTTEEIPATESQRSGRDPVALNLANGPYIQGRRGARPEGFRLSLEALGAEVARLVTYPDHHLSTRAEIEGLDPGLTWVTTAKDAVKIPSAWAGRRRELVLEEEVEPEEPHELVEWVVERLASARRAG